jgi:RNA polymerase sigma-70 factor (ECF subfamily)
MHDAEEIASPGPAATGNEMDLVAALRSGDEATFESLLSCYNGPMLRLALSYVRAPAVAEEVVQETWLAVLQGIDRFEARSSLRTWLFRILTNQARTWGAREGRCAPFSALWQTDDAPEAAVDLGRFDAVTHHWVTPPARWAETPEERLLSGETRALLQAAIADLPPNQRAVISLRDVEGWAADEVCSVLGVSETNQRVLLHRARSRVRRALAQHLALD